MTEDDVEAVEMLWMELAQDRAHLDTECTGDNVEQEGARFQEVIGKPFDATAEKIWICARSHMWWNADIKKRIKGVRT